MRFSLTPTILVLVTACKDSWRPGAAESAITGELIGATYTNRYFGFSMDVPRGWSQKAKSGADADFALGASLFGDEKMRERTPEIINDPDLRMILGIRDGKGSSLMIVARRVPRGSGAPRLTIMQQALEHTFDTFARSGELFGKEVGTGTLFGNEFARVAGTIRVAGTDVVSTSFGRAFGRWVLTIHAAANNEHGHTTCESILASFRPLDR